MQTINIDKLKEMAHNFPEIKRLCQMKHAPVYLLQMELERYKVRLDAQLYPQLKITKF